MTASACQRWRSSHRKTWETSNSCRIASAAKLPVAIGEQYQASEVKRTIPHFPPLRVRDDDQDRCLPLEWMKTMKTT